jgi:uncharacterized transporter YbjL
VKNQKQPSNEARNQHRREFLKTTTLLGAGVAAGAMTSTAVIADVGTDDDEKPTQKGYQLSQHVLDYYKSADV